MITFSAICWASSRKNARSKLSEPNRILPVLVLITSVPARDAVVAVANDVLGVQGIKYVGMRWSRSRD